MIAHNAPDLDLSDKRNWRTRASIHVVMDGTHLQVDAGPEFRVQCLENDIQQTDHFFLTHSHADHIMGMDDLRRFCVLNGCTAMPVYADATSLERVRSIYPYACREVPEHKYYPTFALHKMPDELELECGWVRHGQLMHGKMAVMGLVFEERSSGKRAAYFTDCKTVSPRARELATGADLLAVDALQPIAHPTHMSVDEATTLAKELNAGQTWFTHMSYLSDHATVEAGLPDGIRLAYDGLRITL